MWSSCSPTSTQFLLHQGVDGWVVGGAVGGWGGRFVWLTFPQTTPSETIDRLLSGSTPNRSNVQSLDTSAAPSSSSEVSPYFYFFYFFYYLFLGGVSLHRTISSAFFFLMKENAASPPPPSHQAQTPPPPSHGRNNIVFVCVFPSADYLSVWGMWD